MEHLEPLSLNPKAPDWRPSFVLRPPPKPFQSKSITVKKPFDLIECMECLYSECMKRFSTFTCRKVSIQLNYHPNHLKKPDEAFLATYHPTIRIIIRENQYIDFYCVDELIWPYCNVGFRAPMGANLFNWSVKDLNEVANGMDRLIKRCYPDIFPTSLYSYE